MARPKKEKPTHSSGQYVIKKTVGKGLDGKAIRKAFYSDLSKADCEAKYREWLVGREIDRQTSSIQIKADYTFAEWSYKWLETYKKPHVSENTYRLTYENTVEKHLIPFFGKANMADIKPIDVQKFFEGKTSYSETMLNKMRLCLRGIFETAIDNDVCYKNPVKNISYTSTANKHEKKVYTAEQIAQVKEIATHVFPEVVILLETGLRRGELLGLQWDDIDLTQRIIKVQRSIAMSQSERVAINPPKWDSYRTIVLREGDMSLKLLRDMMRTCEWVFANKNNQLHAPNSWSQKLEHFMDTAISPLGLPTLTAHELRHTYGTDLRRRGVDIYTIQKLLGHRDIKMTSELYVHNEIDELKKAIR